MTPVECAREFEVAAVVRAGRWPAACEPALRGHVAGCDACQDVVAIVQALAVDDDAADVAVPSAAQVWWRFAVRARLEREQAAAGPVVWLHGLAAACGAGLALAALPHWAPALSATATAVAGRVSSTLPAVVAPAAWSTITDTSRLAGLAAPGGLALLAVVASAAVYLWTAED